MFDRYTLLHVRIFLTAWRRGKINVRKLWNAFVCTGSYYLKRPFSGRAPIMLSLEVGNDCNVNCLFCRDEKGRIPDMNPEGIGFMRKGRMRPEIAEAVIEATSKDALIAVLYTDGEPLLYPDLFRLARFATARNLASMIATNGTLLTEKNCREIMDSGIDFVKIAVSGWSREVHNVQARFGDVEKIREGITRLVRLDRETGRSVLIMVDYISYSYNQQELPLMQKFCQDLGIMMSVRPGNPQGGLEGKERPLSTEPLPLKISCDWLWKGMQVDWNGDIQHCCECGVWSGTDVYGRIEPGVTDVLSIWNGPQAQAMRRSMKQQGRRARKICVNCLRKGITFKW